MYLQRPHASFLKRRSQWKKKSLLKTEEGEIKEKLGEEESSPDGDSFVPSLIESGRVGPLWASRADSYGTV